MKIKNRAKPKTPPVEPGIYIAVCVHSIDLGEQLIEKKGEAPRLNNQVTLTFELVGETMEVDGKTRARDLSRTFNVCYSKNGALRKFVQSWLGKAFSDEAFAEFDTNDLVGRAAQLSVIHSENGEYANIDAALPLPKGMPAPKATLPLIRFDLEPWDAAAFQALPDWARDRVKRSTQYQEDHVPTGAVDVDLGSSSTGEGDAGAGEENPI